MTEKNLCVVTGASSGIGFAVVKLLVNKGYPCLMLARRVEEMKKLVKENKIDEKLVLCEKLDVVDLKKFEEVVAKGEKHFGKEVDLIVNNAGVMYLNPFESQSEKEFKTMVDVNVLGVYNGCRVVLPKMTKRKRGTIINVSSIAGRKGFPNHVAYCGTKFAIHGMTETLREEVAKTGVRVSIIAPGVVYTNLLNVNTKETIDGYKKWSESCGKMLNAEDVANSVYFIFSQPQHVCIREILLAGTVQDA